MSAINAGGIEAFVPWPATQRVTVAADRDEAKKGAGYRRGEHAARTFGLRNCERIRILIALPGEPGQSIDWTEIFVSDGAEAVRSGILGADFLSLLTMRSRTFGRGRPRCSSSRQSQRPIRSRCWRRYAFSISRQKAVKSGCTNRPARKATSRAAKSCGLDPSLQAFRRARAAAHGRRGRHLWLRVCVQDMGGQPRAVDFDRAELARLGASEIRARLLEAGLRVEGDGEFLVT